MWPFGRKKRRNRPHERFLVAFDYRDCMEMLDMVADELPFLGEEPFRVSKRGRWTRPAYSDDAFLRRVFVSWLAGRPVSHVAERAGCSERLVLNLVRNLIYADEDYLEESFTRWVELGLVAAVDGPLFEDEPDHLDPYRHFEPRYVPVFCLVCHRVAGKLSLDPRRYDGGILAPEDPRWKYIEFFRGPNHFGTLEYLQAHLMVHFELRFDPIAVRSAKLPDYRDRQLLEEGKLKGKRARSIRSRLSLDKRLNWFETISQPTLYFFLKPRSGQLGEMAPVRGGQPIEASEAIRMWMRLLE